MSNPSNPNDYVDQFGTRQQTNSQGALGGITQGLFGGPGINGAAPTIDASGMTSAITQAQQGRGLQGQAAGLAGQLARGQGPSAVSQAYNQQVNNSTAAANALASSASGADQAMARRQAMMASAQGQQAAGGSAALGHAQEQLGGVGMMGSLAGQQRGQDLATGNLLGGLASNQANLQEQQNQANLQAAESQSKQNANSLMSMAGMAAGALAFADAPMNGTTSGGSDPQGSEMHLKEPNGPSHFILREEPDFILIVNARTGKMGKLPMMPLSPEEQKQAMAPHGAGPIGQSVNAIRAGDAQLSNLNDDPNQDSGGDDGLGAMAGMAGQAMAAGDYRFGEKPRSVATHGAAPHVTAPHVISMPDPSKVVRQKHGALYYGDLDMDSPDMSRLDFDKLGPGGTSKNASMPVQKMDDRNFGKYSTPGRGVGGGDATDPDAATGADPYAANPGEDNPATNPDSKDPSFGKVLAGALKGYADPQSLYRQQAPAPTQVNGPPSPGVSSPMVMHDGTTSGADPSVDRGAQMIQQLDQQRMGLSRVGEGTSMMGYNPQNIAKAADPQKLGDEAMRGVAAQYNSSNSDQDRREMLRSLGLSKWTGEGGAADSPIMSPPTHLSYGEVTDVYNPYYNDHAKDFTPSNTADEGLDRPKLAHLYEDLPQGDRSVGEIASSQWANRYLGRIDPVTNQYVPQVQNKNGRIRAVPAPRPVQSDDEETIPDEIKAAPPKAKPLTQKFANRPKPKGKKTVLQDLSARGKSA